MDRRRFLTWLSCAGVALVLPVTVSASTLLQRIKDDIERACQGYLFEPNDALTRDAIKTQTKKTLEQMLGQRRIYDYDVICDERNNTMETIDNNELHVDVFYQENWGQIKHLQCRMAQAARL